MFFVGYDVNYMIENNVISKIMLCFNFWSRKAIIVSIYIYIDTLWNELFNFLHSIVLVKFVEHDEYFILIILW